MLITFALFLLVGCTSPNNEDTDQEVTETEVSFITEHEDGFMVYFKDQQAFLQSNSQSPITITDQNNNEIISSDLYYGQKLIVDWDEKFEDDSNIALISKITATNEIGDQFNFSIESNIDTSEDNQIELKANPVMIVESIENLEYSITNNTQKTITVGRDYTLEKRVDEQWLVQNLDLVFTTEGYEIPSNQSITQSIDINTHFPTNDSTSLSNYNGLYRIVKKVNESSQSYATTFEINIP